MKKFYIAGCFFSLIALNAQNKNTGINTTDPKATLDVNLPSNYTNGQLAGVAIPQLTGDQIEAMSASTPKVGTIVYATAVSTAATKDVTAVGYWYWKDATDKWEPFTLGTSASGNTVDWSVNGNSGTAAANYLGTKDNQPLNFKTNATTDTNPKMTILPNGNVGVGRTQPAYQLEVKDKIGVYSDDWGHLHIRTFSEALTKGSVVGLSRSRGTEIAPVYSRKDDILGMLVFRDAISYSSASFGGAQINGYAEEDISTIAKGSGLMFATTGLQQLLPTEKMRITANGNVGISTTNPQAKLHIDGAADNPATGTPTAAQVANDVVVTSTGKIGVGTLKPFGEIEAVSNTFERGIYSTGLYNSYGGVFGVRSARGDIGNLQPTQTTNGLGWFTGYGYDGTSFALPSNGHPTGMLLRATENYTPTGTGAEIDFYTIPNGTRTGISRMLISQNGNVGINNQTPQAKLDIVAPTAGTGFKLQDGSQGDGKVLVSNASGNATWSTTKYDDRVKVHYDGPVPTQKVFSSVNGDYGSIDPIKYTFPVSITLTKGSWMVYVHYRIDGVNTADVGGVILVATSGTIYVNNYNYASKYEDNTWYGFAPVQVDVTSNVATISPQWALRPGKRNGALDATVRMGLATTAPSIPCADSNNYGCLPFFAIPIK